MSDQQSCQPEITREKCEEIVDKTTSILGDIGTLISGPIGLLVSLIAILLSAVTFAIAYYTFSIETRLLRNNHGHSSMFMHYNHYCCCNIFHRV